MLPGARTSALLSLPLLLACGETPFCTTATYAAPRTGLTIWISAQGTIPSGADLADVSSGYARRCPSGSAGAPLDLPLPSPGASIAPDAANLSAQLASAGYTVGPGEAMGGGGAMKRVDDWAGSRVPGEALPSPFRAAPGPLPSHFGTLPSPFRAPSEPDPKCL